MASERFRVGERVEWASGDTTVRGRVIAFATESGRIDDYVYDASAESPRYLVETEKGRRVAYRPGALRSVRPEAAVESSHGG